MENTVAIHESKDSDNVVKFINLDNFNKDFQTMHENGNIYGCYYNEKGEIVAQDIWDEIHTIIQKAEQ